MLDKPTYEQRTTTFCEWSTYEWSREQWASIKFLGPDGNGGMISEIAESRPYEFISIRHLGEISMDETTGKLKETTYPTPGYENYTFTEKDWVTTLEIFMGPLPDEYATMFNDMRPKALQALKEICEKQKT